MNLPTRFQTKLCSIHL